MVKRLKEADGRSVLHTDGVPEGVLQEAVQHSSVAENNGSSYDDHKDDKDSEVQNGEADNTSLAQLGLLE